MPKPGATSCPACGVKEAETHLPDCPAHKELPAVPQYMRPGSTIQSSAPKVEFAGIAISQIELVSKPEWKWSHILLDGELIGYALDKHKDKWDALLSPVMVIKPVKDKDK